MTRDRKDLGARKHVRVDLRKPGFLIPAPDAPWIGRSLIQRLRDQPDSEDGLSGFIQQLHLPFGVFDQLAGNVADHVAADTGHFLPRCVPVEKFRTLVADAGLLAILDAEEEDRHGVITNAERPPLGLGKPGRSARSGFPAGRKFNSGYLRA
jgi:hypothetical protein